MKPRTPAKKILNSSPLSWRGGKFNMADRIIKLMPPHYTYVEPFFGGGAVFFQKKRSQFECINDLDSKLYRFYKVCKENGEDLYARFKDYLCFEDEYKETKEVFHLKKQPKDEIDFAYCYFITNVLSYTSAGNHLSVGHKYKRIWTNIEILRGLKLRFKRVLILNRDAVKVIKSLETKPGAFFYLDPPYPETDQKPYEHQFSLDDFNAMLDVLKKTPAKWLLSCYIKDGMNFDPSWNIRKFKSIQSITQSRTLSEEALVFNYDPPKSKIY